MRNPDRIPEVLERVGRVWRENPDLRLLQLLLAPHPTRYSRAPFYVEDDDLVEALEWLFGAPD